MRRISRSALVPYTAAEMFALVADIETYPDFVPWCDKASVDSRSDDVQVATLTFSRGFLSRSFTTRNTLMPPDTIDMQLVDGPFKSLQGQWRFRNLGDAGCKVGLDIDFEFASASVDLLFGGFFEDICERMIESFTTRAHNVYG